MARLGATEELEGEVSAGGWKGDKERKAGKSLLENSG